MLKKLTLGAALVAAAAFLTPASAAPPVTQAGVAVDGATEGLVQQVHWRHRHRHHRHYYGGYYYPRYYGYYDYGYYPYYRRHRHHHHRHHRHHHHW